MAAAASALTPSPLISRSDALCGTGHTRLSRVVSHGLTNAGRKRSRNEDQFLIANLTRA